MRGTLQGLIERALLDDHEVCQCGALFAIRISDIVVAAQGRLPFAQQVPVPFEREVRNLLPNDANALGDAANQLGLVARPYIGDVARGLLLAGVAAAANALSVLAVDTGARNKILDMVAAAKLHHEAVAALSEATTQRTTSVVRTSADEMCVWYTRRACHQLKIEALGNRLLQLDLAGHEETAETAQTAADPIRVAADAVLAMVRARAQRQWDPKFCKLALAGHPKALFCVALHNEDRVPVVEALRTLLPNAHFLIVTPHELILSDEDSARVKTIAPHIQDEDTLIIEYATVCETTASPRS